jgi:uncharacterized membrane protein YjgN (DUF898 family)
MTARQFVYETPVPLTATAPARVHSPPVVLTWRHLSGLVRLALLNFALNVVTLGMYQFWAKAEVRKRIWASVRLNGEPLSYAGSGRELFHGFLIALVIVAVPALMLPLFAMVAFGNAGVPVAQVVLYVAFAFLFGFAVWRAQRYRLSRTSWRGIRFGLDGSGLGYAWASFWTLALIPLTLGWIVPWRSTMLQKRLIGGMSLGDRRFTFDAKTGPLYLRYLVMWVVTAALLVLGPLLATRAGMLAATQMSREDAATLPPQMVAGVIVAGLLLMMIYGLTSAWYRAAQFNHFARATRLGDIQFNGRMSGFGLFGLTLGNWAIAIASLGLLLPLIQARSAHYMISRLDVIGGETLEAITQSAADPSAAKGEGLANAFNFDAF